MDKSFNNTLDIFINQDTKTEKASIVCKKGNNSLNNLATFTSFNFSNMNQNSNPIIKNSQHEISQC